MRRNPADDEVLYKFCAGVCSDDPSERQTEVGRLKVCREYRKGLRPGTENLCALPCKC